MRDWRGHEIAVYNSVRGRGGAVAQRWRHQVAVLNGDGKRVVTALAVDVHSDLRTGMASCGRRVRMGRVEGRSRDLGHRLRLKWRIQTCGARAAFVEGPNTIGRGIALGGWERVSWDVWHIRLAVCGCKHQVGHVVCVIRVAIRLGGFVGCSGLQLFGNSELLSPGQLQVRLICLVSVGCRR